MAELEEVVLKAGSAYAEGRYEEALRLYERAVLGHPNNAVLHANISAILLRLSKPEEALGHAETAVRLQPKWGKAHYRKGEALRRLGNHSEALLPLCNSIRFEPPPKQCFSSLRDCSIALFPSFPSKEMEKLGLNENRFALLATVGQLLLSEGRLEEAVKVLTWTLQMESPSLKLKASALACLGSAHYRLDDPRRAIDYYEQQMENCLELGSGDISALRNVATAAESAEEWELALRCRKKLMQNNTLSLDEKNEERQSMGELLLHMDRGEEALLILEKGLFKTLRDKINLACARGATGDCDRALTALTPLRPECDRLFTRTLEAVCRSFLGEGRLQEAINYLEDVMDHCKKKDKDAVWKAACSLQCKNYLRMGSVDHALRLAKRLLRMGRDYGDRDAEARALRHLATAYEQQGDFNSSLLLLEKYLTFAKKKGEIARTQMDIAKILVKQGLDPTGYFERAMESSEMINDNKIRAQVYSAALRYYKSIGELLAAEDLLQRQKNLLQCELDGTTRSLIFEDMAFLSAEESGSSSSVTALEHSLAEAQEANNVHRELELLELLGDELAKLGRRREAEGLFNRFLALAKQLRLASHIQRGHEKLAREFKLRGAWSLCADHAKSALTVAKIQQDVVGRTAMLLLIGEAEMEREEWDTAMVVFKKALGLAKAAQIAELEAETYQYLARWHGRNNNPKEEQRHLQKYVNLCPKPTSELCETLLKLVDVSEPAEAVGLLRKCRAAAGELADKEKNILLLSCFSRFLSMNLSDEAIHCLRLFSTQDPIMLSPHLFDHPLQRQLPILQYLSENWPHCSSVHSRLCLLGSDKNCEVGVTCQLISAWKHKDWEAILKLNKNGVDLSVINSEDLELLELMARWELERDLPIDLNQLSAYQQLELHRLSWTHQLWRSVPSVIFRSQMASGAFFNPLDVDLPLLEKIICSVFNGEDELVSMWFEEMTDELKTEEIGFFERAGRDLRLAAAFLALAETDIGEQMKILESTKWELDRHILSEHGLPPPPPVDYKRSFSFVFSLDEVELVWLNENGSVKFYLSNLSPTPSFHIHLLVQFARKRGIFNLPESPPVSELLITNCQTSLPAKQISPWLRTRQKHINLHRRIWLLSLTDASLRGAVQCTNRPRSLVFRKFGDCHIAVLDSSTVPSVHEIVSIGSAPDVVISTDRLPFPISSALMLMGCSVVVELSPSVTPSSIDLLIDQLHSGDPVSLCVSHTSHRLLGDGGFRIESDATMGRLRHIIREDAESFLVLARSWRQGGRLGEPWTEVARSLVSLSTEEIGEIIPLLGENDTDFINSIYLGAPGSPIFMALEDGMFREQFALLYSDHLFLEGIVEEIKSSQNAPVETVERSRPPNSPEDSGYVSDGEYLVAPRRQRTAGNTRSSATVISVHIPK